MIQLKYMLAVFQKRPFYFNIPSKHAQEKCLNVDFLTGVQGVQKKCMFEVEISSRKEIFFKKTAGMGPRNGTFFPIFLTKGRRKK